MLERLDFSSIEAFIGDPAPLQLFLAVAVVVLLMLVVFMRAGRSREQTANQASQQAAQMEFAELKGRLSAMAELAAQQSSEQSRGLGERIDTLARHLSQSLDNTAARLGDNLNEAGRRTSETLSTLNERLALIDE